MKLKILFIFFNLCCCVTLLQGQIKIGDNPQDLNAASVLELESTSRALVITRVSMEQMNTISPLNGALVYNTDTQCVHYYDGTEWINMCAGTIGSSTISLVNNENGTYTFTNANEETTDITNTTNQSITLENNELVLTDSDNNSISVPLAEIAVQTFTTTPIENTIETIIITQTGTNYNIEVNQISGAQILDFSVGSNDIQGGAINTTHLQDRAVGPDKIEEAVVTSYEIENQSINTIDIAPGGSNQVLKTNDVSSAVEWSTLNSNSIDGLDIINNDGSLEIANGAGAALANVEIIIAPEGVTNDKLAADAVTTDKILDGEVQTNDIASGTENQFLRTNNLGQVEWALLEGLVTATDVTYDPSTSGLPAVDVQTAIDELTTSSSTIDLTDNNDGTYTFTKADGSTVTISDTSISTLVDEGNGTYTYTDETGTTQIIDTNGTTISNTVAGNIIATISEADGSNSNINETITNLVDNLDGTIEYTKEDGTTNTINKADITDNGNGTYTFTNNGGTNVSINTNAISNPYDPTTSLLAANNVQEAIDILASGGASDLDGDPSNEIQTLTLAANQLGITNGNSVSLNSFLDNTDEQQLSIVGSRISLTDGGFVDLPAETVDTDEQDLSLTGNTLNITNGTGVDLTPILGGVDTDEQDLSLAGNTLNITNGTGVDLTPILGGVDTDEQNLSLVGNTLNITNGTGVDLTPILSDNQTAIEVPFTKYLSLNSPNTQGAIQQLKDELAAALLAGGGDPNDEIQDLEFTAGIISLTGDPTPTTIDLSPYLDDQTVTLADGGSGNVAIGGTYPNLTIDVASLNDADFDPTNENQTVSQGTGITVNQTGQNFEIVNAAPDQTITLADGGSGNVAIGGTYPNLTIDVASLNDADFDPTNENQTVSQGTGITVNQTGQNFEIVNAAPDQTITLADGGSGNVAIGGTYPNLTIDVASLNDADFDPTNENQTVSQGTGITVNQTGQNFEIVNAAPDQTVTLADGGSGNVAIGGTYPNLTIDVASLNDADFDPTNENQTVSQGTGITVNQTGQNFEIVNAAPDQTITLADGGSGNVAIGGTYPNLTIDVASLNDADFDPTNENQTVSQGTGITVNQTGQNFEIVNAAPDQTVTLADGGSGNVAIGGTYPNLTIDVDGSETIIDATNSTVGVTGAGTSGDPYIITEHTGTPGSIFFADTDNTPTENDTQLFWDATNNWLGVGTDTPDVKLRVNGQVKASSIVSNPNGSETSPPFRFANDANSGMFLAAVDELAFTTNENEAMRIIANQNVGIGTTTPTSTLHTGGSFAANIRNDGALTVNILDNDYTIIVTAATDLDLPAASATNLGRIYIIKNLTGGIITMTSDNFIPSNSTTATSILPIGISQLQSDGTNWQQIN